MFVNCMHCKALVATDPATDLPPQRCPRCAGVLRELQAPVLPTVPATDATAVAMTAPAEAVPASPSAADGSASTQPQAPESVPTTAPAAGATTAVTAAEAAAPLADATPGAAGETGTAPSATAPATADTAGPSDDDASTGPDPVTTTAGPDPAAATVAAQPPPPPAPAATNNTAPTAEPVDGATATAASDAPVPNTEAATGEPSLPSTARTGADADASAAARPAFLAKTAAAAGVDGRRRWRLPVAIAALVLLLALQAVLADRERLAADARWRPLVASACGVFGCSLPPWREPEAFVLLTREVRPHPGVAGALRVRASFRNDARWAQALPRLVLTLSDVDGRAVAARAFDAGEYLAAATTASLVQPGQTVDIALDIREPSVATVSYAFDFR